MVHLLSYTYTGLDRPFGLQEIEAPRILCIHYPKVIAGNYLLSFMRFEVLMAVKIQIGNDTV
jgi:hypothetical protein